MAAPYTSGWSGRGIDVVVVGLFIVINNTLVTQGVMRIAPVERGVASAAYSFVRFAGAGIPPFLAGKLAAWYDPHVPFYVGAAGPVLALAVLATDRRHLSNPEGNHP